MSWDDVERLFAAAVEREEAERARLLAAADVSEPTREEVARLLRAHDSAGGFLERLDAGAAARLVRASHPDPERIGRFVLERRLGTGGMGVVYLARDPVLDRLVALKVLPEWIGRDSAARRRFESEARAASALDHPAVAAVHEFGEADDGTPYLVMPYCSAGTVADLVSAGPVPPDRAIRIAGQSARGLAAAHARGLVHRDVKPANILLTADGDARVADFGIAAARGEAHRGPAGTPAYMSPEQRAGAVVDPRSDVWSLGVTLFEMLTGQRPADGTTADELARRAGTVAPSAAAVIRRCLAPNPDDRYRDAAELADALASGRSRGARTAVALAGTAAVATAVTAFAVLLGGEAPRSATRDAVAENRLAVLPLQPLAHDTALAGFGRAAAVTLGRSLDGAFGMRVVEPTAVLAAASVERPALEAARALGAAMYLTGTLAREGDQVRAEVLLVGAPGARDRVAASAVGSPDSLGPLSERLAVAVLGRLAALRNLPVPSPRALGTTSVEAIRAYVAGEQAIVDGRFRSAPEEFARAIAADSTFWLAYARYWFARSYHGAPVPDAIVERLLANRAALPEPDRMLVEARMETSLLRRIAARREVLDRFPDYWPAWFELGDALLHDGPYVGYAAAEARAAFQRALELNPGFVPAAEHLFWIAVRERDTAAARRLFGRLEARRLDTLMSRESDLAVLELYRYLEVLGRNGGTPDPRYARRGVEELSRHESPVAPERVATNVVEEGFPRAQLHLARGVRAATRSPQVRSAQDWAETMSWLALGEWDSSLAAGRRYAAATRMPDRALWTYGIAVLGASLGRVDPEAAAGLRPTAQLSEPAARAERRWLDGVLAWSRSDAPALRRAAAGIAGDSAPGTAALRRSLLLLARALDGDSVGAARELGALERETGDAGWHVAHAARHPYLSAVNRLLAARWLLAAGDTADAARTLLWYQAVVPGARFPAPVINAVIGRLEAEPVLDRLH